MKDDVFDYFIDGLLILQKYEVGQSFQTAEYCMWFKTDREISKEDMKELGKLGFEWDLKTKTFTYTFY